jgi:hypothetical protein
MVNGRRGLSELEPSQLDQAPGKRLWAAAGTSTGSLSALVSGRLSHAQGGAEQLEVTVQVEPFDNGASVSLTILQSSATPDEMTFTIHSNANSAPLEACILTATMGNLARTRLLWLRDETVSSLKLYPTFKWDGFAPHNVYSLDRLARTVSGDVLVAVTTDEEDPASVVPFPGTRRWRYNGIKVSQYWKRLHGTVGAGLEGAVNARYTYWQTRQPIPGGVAFENFELREPFCEGQQFIFGITRKTPAQLGLGAR